MNDNPCRKLEKERDEIWREWEAAHAAEQAAVFPPSATLGPGEPGKILDAIDKARQAMDEAFRKLVPNARDLLKCYEENNVPPELRSRGPGRKR